MDWFIQLLKTHHIAPVFVPGGTTGDNQPQDLSVNRPFKATARAQFEAWLASLSDAELARAGSLPALKANVLSWISAGVDHVRAHSDKMVLAGWRRAGILPRCFDASFQERAKFVVLNASAASAVPLPGEYTTDANLERLRALAVPASELVGEEEEIDSGVIAAPVPPVPAHLPPLPDMPAVAAVVADVAQDADEEGERVVRVLCACVAASLDFVFPFFVQRRTSTSWTTATRLLALAACIARATTTTRWTSTTTTTVTTTTHSPQR
jgi:hypothetical protein